jgi:hypothetical protein
MKMMLAVFLTLGSFGAFADHHMEGTVEEQKAKMTEHIDKHITHLTEAKTCVANAKDEASLKTCREKMREHRKSMKKDMEGRKKKK